MDLSIVFQAGFSKDGKTIFTLSGSGRLHIWSASDGKINEKFQHDGLVDDAIFSNNGPYIYGYQNINDGNEESSLIHIWNLNKNKTKTIPTPKNQFGYLTLSEDGKYLITSDLNSKSRVWYIENDTMLHPMNTFPGTWATFSKGADWVLTDSWGSRTNLIPLFS